MVRNEVPKACIQRHLNYLCKQWAKLAELEVCQSRHFEVPFAGCRGRLPRLVWKSALGLESNKEVKQPTLYSLRWPESTSCLLVSLLQEWQRHARQEVPSQRADGAATARLPQSESFEEPSS
eukprot:3612582-Pyramimonas_sp.AAC.1